VSVERHGFIRIWNVKAPHDTPTVLIVNEADFISINQVYMVIGCLDGAIRVFDWEKALAASKPLKLNP